MIRLALVIFVFSFSSAYAIENNKINGQPSTFLSTASEFLNRGDNDSDGTKWAVLVAGSSGWGNYRHQADVCHAYQILKNGGLKDENIIVMMYDDIANNPSNPRPGVIINSPKGHDVYHGVPKDYTGDNITRSNFFNVILGNKTAIRGGSGKVVRSGPKDHIFIYYSDHGGPYVLELPTGLIYTEELNKVLQQKHAMGTYKSMVFYLEACDSGSMFDGVLSKNMNIYVTTASGPDEDSYAYYCPGEEPAPPKEFDTCLGDLYSVAWMENTEHNNRTTINTLHQQYTAIKKRTNGSSHVMEYGDLSICKEKLSVFMGSNLSEAPPLDKLLSEQLLSSSVNQRDAELLHLREKFSRAPIGSKQQLEAINQIMEAVKHRENVDNNIKMIGDQLLGLGRGIEMMKKVRPAGENPIDDWDCFKAMLQTYEARCGPLSTYGRKYNRVFANICNAGVRQEQMEKVVSQACSTKV